MSAFEFIPHELVNKHLTYSTLLPAMRSAFKEFSSEDSNQVRRTVLWMGENRRQYVMPAYSKQEDILSTKILNIFPDNAVKGHPIKNSYLLLFNERDGTLKCVMESEPLSWKRTAAASVVATQSILKRTPRILAVLGTGNQAYAHINAFMEAYKFEEIKVWGRNLSSVEKLAVQTEFPISKCASAEDAVGNADIVVTATSSQEPVLKGIWLKDGCHVNVVGAMKSNWRETDDDCMKDAVVYTDSIDAAQRECGDIILSKVSIYAEVGEILLKKKSPKYGRITLFKSTGVAIQDAHAAKIVWENYSNSKKPNQ